MTQELCGQSCTLMNEINNEKQERENWDRDMGEYKFCLPCKAFVIPHFSSGPGETYEMTCECGELLDED
jgi:hypothetical protein